MGVSTRQLLDEHLFRIQKQALERAQYAHGDPEHISLAVELQLNLQSGQEKKSSLEYVHSIFGDNRYTFDYKQVKRILNLGLRKCKYDANY